MTNGNVTMNDESDLLYELEVSAIVAGQMLSIMKQGLYLNKSSDQILDAIAFQCSTLIEGHEDLIIEYFKGDS